MRQTSFRFKLLPILVPLKSWDDLWSGLSWKGGRLSCGKWTFVSTAIFPQTPPARHVISSYSKVWSPSNEATFSRSSVWWISRPHWRPRNSEVLRRLLVRREVKHNQSTGSSPCSSRLPSTSSPSSHAYIYHSSLSSPLHCNAPSYHFSLQSTGKLTPPRLPSHPPPPQRSISHSEVGIIRKWSQVTNVSQIRRACDPTSTVRVPSQERPPQQDPTRAQADLPTTDPASLAQAEHPAPACHEAL